jgi:hypothetical protein
MVSVMEVTKVVYSDDGKEFWMTIRSEDADYLILHLASNERMLWSKDGQTLNVKPK